MSKTSSKIASQIALEYFNLKAKSTTLNSYADENFLLETDSGEKFLLKISNEAAKENLDFQVRLLQHLSEMKLPCLIARTVLGKNGNALAAISRNKTARLLSWIPGRLWATVNPKTDVLRNNLGKVAGTLTTALQDFEHPAAHRRLDWDLANADWTKRYLNRFSGEEKKMISYFQQRFSEVEHTYRTLPKSVVHNDLNDYNILVSEDISNPS